ncbi:MAG: hypothetical protein JRJ24_16075, partial [Deltaproteobacteria bacterium]|nr:hypothetical protein [Deltaproteobacteria bacterium]
YYDLEQMQRAMRDIAIRSDIVYPAHDPLVLEEDFEKRREALTPEKPWP